MTYQYNYDEEGITLNDMKSWIVSEIQGKGINMKQLKEAAYLLDVTPRTDKIVEKTYQLKSVHDVEELARIIISSNIYYSGTMFYEIQPVRR